MTDYRALAKQGGEKWRMSVEDRFAAMVAPMDLPPAHDDTNPTWETIGPISLTNGQKLKLNKKRIVADYNGIHGNDNVSCELDLQDVEIITKFGATPAPQGWSGYGIFANPCTSARLVNVKVMSAGYALRGRFDKWRSEMCFFESNDQNFRLWKTSDLISNGDIFRGKGRMILGGSAGGPDDPHEEFANAQFSGGKIGYSALEFGRNTHHVTFRDEDFTGCAQIGLWDGVHDLLWERCKKDGRALHWGDFKNGAQLEAGSMSRNLRITV